MSKSFVCSIVWKDFKNGMKWLDGNFHEDPSIQQSEDLKILQDEFEAENDLTTMSLSQLGVAAQQFLEMHGYEVAFNDWLQNIDEALGKREAKEFIKLLKREKEVKFKYKKASDGTIRKARGTLNPEVIKQGLSGEDIDRTRRRRHIPDSIIVYWDLDRKMFRSFRKANFISYSA